MCKTGGEICQSRGEIIIFSKQGGNVLKQEKWGEIRNFWSTTKKRSSEILADENQKIFREEVKFGKFSTELENFSETGGNLKQGGNHHCLRGMDAPVCTYTHTYTNIRMHTHTYRVHTYTYTDTSIHNTYTHIHISAV